MIPDRPHNIRIRLAELNFLLLLPDVAKSLPCWLSQFWKAQLRQPTGQISIGPILFLYYEESLISSNFNSKQLRFHGVRPNVCGLLKWIRALQWCIQLKYESWKVSYQSALRFQTSNFMNLGDAKPKHWKKSSKTLE